MLILNQSIIYLERTLNETHIMTIEGHIHEVHHDPDRIIEHTLTLLGSNLKARKKAAKQLLQESKYLPILIDDLTKVVFFPLHTTKDHVKIYINASHILTIEGDHNAIIHFTNHTTLQTSVSKKFITKQRKRALLMVDCQQKVYEHHFIYS